MAFSVILGPCSVCGDSQASLKVRPKTCLSCGAAYEQMCLGCGAKPCQNCQTGKLEDTDEVFPHSLFRAIANEDESEVIGLLTGRSVDLNDLTDRRGQTPLSLAARCKAPLVALVLCEKLILLGASAATPTKDGGRTTLMLMVLSRTYHPKVAALFRASINAQDKSGQTALMYTAEGQSGLGMRRGNLSIARDLIALGADPLIENKRGYTALGRAIASNDKRTNQEMIDYLQNEMVIWSALRAFSNKYRYDFDKKGHLKLSLSKK